MKHISESIIGKRGGFPNIFNARTGLRQGDIVDLNKNPNSLYMYVSDMNIIDKIFQGGKLDYDYSEGIIFRYANNTRIEFLLVSDYNDDLTFKKPGYYGKYSIKSIWRGDIIIDPKDNVYELLKESNLKALVKTYKKIR